MDTIINFGKYKGKTLHDIYLEDKPYFEWLEAQNKIPNIKNIKDKIMDWYVNEALEIIDNFIRNKEPIFGVDVHTVGFELRNKYISITEICSGFRTLSIINPNDTFDRTIVSLSDEKYQILYKKLEPYWKAIGCPRQDRGLY